MDEIADPRETEFVNIMIKRICPICGRNMCKDATVCMKQTVVEFVAKKQPNGTHRFIAVVKKEC